MQLQKATKDPLNPNSHTKNKRKTYQGGGVKDTNGYHNFTLSPSQKECVDLIRNNIIMFIEGVAGSGKSLSALYYSVKEYIADPTLKIIIVRTPMEATLHDKVGFLPDDLASKLAPHFASSKALLEQLLTPQKVQNDIEGPHKRIQFLAPNFLLGSTLDNAIVIVDEAQTIPPVIMKLLLERIGTNSKMIVLGDPSQVYSSDKNRQGMSDAISKFFTKDTLKPKYEDVGYFRFKIEDCMRSDIVKTVLKAYSQG